MFYTLLIPCFWGVLPELLNQFLHFLVFLQPRAKEQGRLVGQAAIASPEMSRNWSATKPGGTRVDKAVKGLGMVPSLAMLPVFPAAVCICGYFLSRRGSAASLQAQPGPAAAARWFVRSAWTALWPAGSGAGAVRWPPAAPSTAERRAMENNPTVSNGVWCKAGFALTIALILALLD